MELFALSFSPRLLSRRRDRRRLLKTFANLNAYFSKFTIFGDLQLKNLQEKSIKKRAYAKVVK